MNPAGPAAIAVTLICGAAAPASAGGPAHCGGFVRQMGQGEVEVAVRVRRIELRDHDVTGAPLDVVASAALAIAGGAERINLTRVGPGLMIGDASAPITARSIMVRFTFADGAIGAARFPVRHATCAAISTTQ